VFANVHLCDVHPVDVRTWHGRLAASGLHHNTVAKIYRLFRSIMTTIRSAEAPLICRPHRFRVGHCGPGVASTRARILSQADEPSEYTLRPA